MSTSPLPTHALQAVLERSRNLAIAAVSTPVLFLTASLAPATALDISFDKPSYTVGDSFTVMSNATQTIYSCKAFFGSPYAMIDMTPIGGATPTKQWSLTKTWNFSGNRTAYASGYDQSGKLLGSSPTVTILVKDAVVAPPTPIIPAPTITSALTADATVGQTFSYTVTATGNPSTYSANPLPAGLTLAGATISGTPTTAGNYSVTISATNSSGSGSATLVLSIAADVQITPPSTPPITPSPTNHAPVFSSTMPLTYKVPNVGGSIEFQLIATDPDSDSIGYTIASSKVGSIVHVNPTTGKGLYTMGSGATSGETLMATATDSKAASSIVQLSFRMDGAATTPGTPKTPTPPTQNSSTTTTKKTGGCGSGSGIAIILAGMSLALLGYRRMR